MVPVKAIAGCTASGIAPCGGGGREHLGAECRVGVQHELPRLPGAELGETG